MDILKEMDQETAESILDIVLPSGHHSVIEHANFTFSVEGVSRSLTHQLVRHRIASYSQQSQRYIKFDDPDYITPPSVKRNERTEDIFRESMDRAWKDYAILRETGVPDEDARYVLPNAAKNNITITMNARELLHFFSIRCCIRAQWEIRELANSMLELVRPKGPRIFKHAGASCVTLGYCPESESCGKAPRFSEIMETYEKGK